LEEAEIAEVIGITLTDVVLNTTAAKQRAGELIGAVVRDAVPVVVARSLAANLVGTIVKFGSSALGGAKKGDMEPALVCLRVKNARPGKDVFYLRGQRSGDHSEKRTADSTGAVELCTLVRFSTEGRTEADKELKGPHVAMLDGKWSVELYESTGLDTVARVPLMSNHTLRTKRNKHALPRHVTVIDWKKRQDLKVKWTTEEGLPVLTDDL